MVVLARTALLALALAGTALAQWEANGWAQQPPRQYQQINICPGGGKAGTLRVTGSKELSGKADQATIDMTISVARANSSSEAGNSTMDAAGSVIQALTTEPNAVAQDDISTEAVNVSPDTSFSVTRNSTFSYSMRLSVKVVNVTNDVLADVLSSATAAGGRSLAINSIKFSLSETRRTELKRAAQKAAVTQAKDKALRLARELGVSISHIINVQDDPSRRFLAPDQQNPVRDPVGDGKKAPAQSAGPKPAGVAVGTEYIKSTMRISYGICNPARGSAFGATAPPPASAPVSP